MGVVEPDHPLVERDPQLAVLDGRWDRAQRTPGSVVVIAGEAGVGKTALARMFVDGIEEDRVLWGACDPLGTPRPMGPLYDIATDVGDALSELLTSAAHTHEISAAVLAELRAHSCVMVLDDLQWADDGTLDLLHHLIRRMSSTRSLVIGTCRLDELERAHPLRAVLGDIAKSPDAELVTLDPLSVAAVRTLVGARGIDAEDLHRRTGGNPFFVTELLRAGRSELPDTVRDAVLARTVDLDPVDRDVLDLLACAPGGIPDRLLAKLEVGLASLRAIDETGLVQRGRRGLMFRHELSRLAIHDAIPPGGTATLHRRLLAAYESLDRTDEALLVHHAVGADRSDDVVRYARAAGISASRAGAHSQAAEFFATALESGTERSAERAALLDQLSIELYLVNRLPEAIDVAQQALDLRQHLDDTTGEGATHAALAVYEWYNADRPRAQGHADTAIEVLCDGDDPAELGHAYATGAFLAMHLGDVERLDEFRDRAAEIVARVGQRKLADRLEIITAIAAIMAGDVESRGRILALIEREAEHFDEVYSTGYSNLANLDVEQRRLDDAEGVLDVSIPLSVERDIPVCAAWQTGVRARLLMLRGDWDAALDDSSAVLAGPAAPLTRTWPHLVRGLIGLRRGIDGADDDLDHGWQLARKYSEPLRLLPAASAIAERTWLRRERSDQLLDDAADLLVEHERTPGTEWSRGELAVWLHRLGRPVDVDAATVADPYRFHLRGDVSSAVTLWESLAIPYERALALLDCGGTDEAFAALDILDGLGADAVAARVRRDLRSAGVTGIPRGPRPTTRSNPVGLTARQLEVLELISQGLTNAELADALYISPKTADHHVSAILMKLQVSNRGEAACEGRRIGLID